MSDSGESSASEGETMIAGKDAVTILEDAYHHHQKIQLIIVWFIPLLMKYWIESPGPISSVIGSIDNIGRLRVMITCVVKESRLLYRKKSRQDGESNPGHQRWQTDVSASALWQATPITYH